MPNGECETHPDARWDEHYECDDCRDDQEKALQAARELIELLVGFCVHIRQTDPEWAERQEVGILFSKAQSVLKLIEGK